ncbi:single-stranded DNA-binding protein [Actinoplanes sp. M2I2]|uniref:single-stranded DNA-binding protein n=1 Tax=Actinoplanes sp. M2I2 TaxID=1734444 RepID=UPI002020EC6E|nr:single-stranded DNA-binding protein [Actinoplanes sp. M2I2]
MAGETTITVVGNLTDDPELRFTPSGVAVANFRIASTPRILDRQSGEWRDGDPLFLACNIWRDPAEHVAQSLKRGTRVIVTGRLRQRSYETKEGEKRTVYELEVDEIGPSLRYANTKVMKLTRTTEPGSTPSTPAASQASSFEDPWSAPANTPKEAALAGVGRGAADDEPPF